MAFGWIGERHDEWPITVLCRVLEVPRSGFYAWRSRDASAAGGRREQRTEVVEEIHADVKARHGSPRMHAELADRGHECRVSAVARIVREAGIAARAKQQFRRATVSNHPYPVAEDVPDRQFDPEGAEHVVGRGRDIHPDP